MPLSAAGQRWCVLVGQIGGRHQQMQDVGQRLPVGPMTSLPMSARPIVLIRNASRFVLFVDEGLADLRRVARRS